jgi:stearoyl-CoA desaturase (delta-9 desaturase)
MTKLDTPTLNQSLRRRFNWKRLDWAVVIGLVAMHVGALAAPFFFSWSGLIVAVLLYWVTGPIGIALCYHRLLTHRSFETPRWFEYVLTVCGCLAWQGGPVQWVGVHRIHHRHSDADLDPHTPNHGFTWAHMLWCMHKEADGIHGVDAAKDLMRDPGLRFLNKFFWVPQFALLGLVFLGGELAANWGLHTSGLSWVLWGVCLRTALCYHITWFVNSATHTWGYRNYDTDDRSTNLWWVALLSLGEGWHNNHHGDQRAATTSRHWYEVDFTGMTIRVLSWVGLARNIVMPKPMA